MITVIAVTAGAALPGRRYVVTLTRMRPGRPGTGLPTRTHSLTHSHSYTSNTLPRTLHPHMRPSFEQYRALTTRTPQCSLP